MLEIEHPEITFGPVANAYPRNSASRAYPNIPITVFLYAFDKVVADATLFCREQPYRIGLHVPGRQAIVMAHPQYIMTVVTQSHGLPVEKKAAAVLVG